MSQIIVHLKTHSLKGHSLQGEIPGPRASVPLVIPAFIDSPPDSFFPVLGITSCVLSPVFAHSSVHMLTSSFTRHLNTCSSFTPRITRSPTHSLTRFPTIWALSPSASLPFVPQMLTECPRPPGTGPSVPTSWSSRSSGPRAPDGAEQSKPTGRRCDRCCRGCSRGPGRQGAVEGSSSGLRSEGPSRAPAEEEGRAGRRALHTRRGGLGQRPRHCVRSALTRRC